MIRLVTILALIILLTGCGGWGDYVHKSEKYDLRVPFPDGWEVLDRSDANHDFLIAELPSLPLGKITIEAEKVAPDLRANEVYPGFMEGEGDGAILHEFKISNRGTVSCKNTEGRSLEVEWLGQESTMRGFRAIFVGSSPSEKVILKIRSEFKKDDYVVYEPIIKKMISEIEIMK